MKLNIEQIKRMGAFLGLEAELKTQLRYVEGNLNSKKWPLARQACWNALNVLDALIELTDETKREEKPCILTTSEESPETNLKPSQTL